MRAARALTTLDGVGSGDHVYWMADTGPGLFVGLEPFAADGALFGDRLVIVGSPGLLAEVKRLRAVPASTVMINAWETAGPLASAVEHEMRRAKDAGFHSARVLACREPGTHGRTELLDSELGLDEVAARSGATVVCAYLPGPWNGAELEQIMCVHPQTLGSRPGLPGFHMFRSGSKGWKVTGVIDSDGAHAFGSVLRAAVLHTPAVRLCFGEVDLIDAAGMRALVDAALHLPDRSVVIEGANRLVRMSWELSGFAVPEVPVEVLG
ncbi:MEDS domain-containing protein [Streptomyces sp. G-G2]|uniref:MEDS domain-containing protein n=1 Tax=Streptomyces sp. G-G2 TaxID=3046201 RepID=UPI0024B9C8F6|nr:MEDS domain-containing protein [Streptomyces sp. G-G2]MDJ0380311.1 MEDS domain-containing protein [Streptomyces sp. G-G2]